jgi:YVTN family beta-propeller protein
MHHASQKSNQARTLRATNKPALRRWVGLILIALSPRVGAWTGKPLIYVSNYGANTIAVVDSGDSREVQQIPVGQGPLGVAVASDANYVYVANSSDNTVSAINVTNKKSPVSTTIVVGHYPVAIAVNRDGTRVYVTNDDDGTVSVINAATNQVIGTIQVGEQPEGIAITPDGRRVYVTNTRSFDMTVIDTESNTVVKTLRVADNPAAIALSPDGSRAYVVSYSTLSVIDTATNSVLWKTTLGGQLLGVALTPDGKHAYVADRDDNSVLVFNTEDYTFGRSVQMLSPQGVDVTPDGKDVYVAETFANTVSIIDTASNTVVNQLTRFVEPYGVGIVPAKNSVSLFTVNSLDIKVNRELHQARGAIQSDYFELDAAVHLAPNEVEEIRPDLEGMAIRIGPFSNPLPASAFVRRETGTYGYERFIGRTQLTVDVKKINAVDYAIHAAARNVGLAGVTNPVEVSLTFGDLRRSVMDVSAHIERVSDAEN